MKKLMICHFNFLFNKTVILILIITTLLSLFSIFISIITYKDEKFIEVMNEMYFSSVFFITKIIGTFLTIFLITYSFLKKNDEYNILLITSNIKRIKMCFSKITVIFIIEVVYYLIIVFNYYLIGIIVSNKFINDYQPLLAYIKLILLSFYYGLLSMILCQLCDNIYIIIIPISLFLLGAIVNESLDITIIKNIYNIFFPNFYNQSKDIYGGVFYIVACDIILVVINFMIYSKKDFQ